MVQESTRLETLFEHRFWLQIMGDHCRFILASLSSDETQEVARARHFIGVFDELLERARRGVADGGLEGLNRQALQHVKELREFKLHLMRRHLVGEIDLGLSPTFLNHMVNELEEYLRVLNALVAGGDVPKFHPIHHHLLWLSDAYFHAAAIQADLDKVEKRLEEKSGLFRMHLEDLYLKAVEMAGYLRSQLDRFPALARFHKEAKVEILLFMQFLQELEEMELTDVLLGTLSALIPDHMFREECYYLSKLAQTAGLDIPACDPTRPRVQPEPKR